MPLTSDPNDPRLTHGVDIEPAPQAEVYLVLSKEERAAKGFVRPYRDRYQHIGSAGPADELRELTDEEQRQYARVGYVRFEAYGPDRAPAIGRYWTQDQLDGVGKGCGAITTMGVELSETYARQPSFYGATYCVGCGMHRPVDEFRWVPDGEVVGS